MAPSPVTLCNWRGDQPREIPMPGRLTSETIISALGRAGYGARAGDIDDVARRGFAAWVDEQLNPREDQDGAVHERLERLRLRRKYGANPKSSAVDETRPQTYLSKSLQPAWPLLL